MPKINFTKVEKSFDRALQKLVIDHITELATLANLIQDPNNKISSEAIKEMIQRFQKELKKLKKNNPELYSKLNLSLDDEIRFFSPSQDYTQKDWENIKALKLRTDLLKKELYGQEKTDAEYDDQVSNERKRHINKRINIRDGWLPLK